MRPQIGLDARAESILERLEAAGGHLIDVLRDQLADGQTDQLSAVHVATSQLEREARELTSRLRGVADALEAELAAVLSEAGAAILTDLQATREAVRSVADDAKQWTGEARSALEWAGEEIAGRLNAATDALQAQAMTSESSARTLVAELTGQVQDLATVLTEQVTSASEAALAGLHRAAAEAAQLLANGALDAEERIAVAREQHLAELKKQIASFTRREATATERREKQVAALTARTEFALQAAVAALSATAGQLAERDRDLESQRADAFVRVLEDVLGRGGVSGRRLRDRVLRGLATTPPPADEVPPPATPRLGAGTARARAGDPAGPARPRRTPPAPPSKGDVT
jgi:predicted phage tail protein